MNIFSAFRGATSLAELRAQIDNAAAEFEAKALHGIRRFGEAEQREFAEKLLICTYLNGSFPACSIPARKAVGNHMRRAFKTLKKADPSLEFRSITIILEEFMTSDEQTVVDLHGLTAKARRILSRMSQHYNAMIEFQVSANVRHPDGGKLQCPHAHVMSYGHNIGDQAHKVAEQVNKRLGPLPNKMMPVHVSEACLDPISLARASVYPYKLPARCKTLYVEPITGKTNQHESTKGDRMIRYERQLETLSSIPLRQLMFAGGDGRAIKTAALRSLADLDQPATTDINGVGKFWQEWRWQTNTMRFQPIDTI